jgi:membrane protease YdiL (CAAX protease family)
MNREIRLFLLFAFGISWAVAGVGVAMGVDAAAGGRYLVMAVLFMFGPAASAVLVTVGIGKRPWSTLELGFRTVNWACVGWTALMGLSLMPLVLLVTWLLGDVAGIPAFGHVALTQDQVLRSIGQALASAGGDPSAALGAMREVSMPGIAWLGLFLGAAFLAACTVNAPVMLGEELGWRGTLFASHGGKGWTRVLLTGVVWGLWHAPLIAVGHNYPGHPIAGIPLMMVFCLLLALLFDWSRVRSGSVWAPVLLHGLINGSAGLFAYFAYDGHWLMASPLGVSGFMAIGLVDLSVLLLDPSYRRSLTSPPPPRAAQVSTTP